MPGAIALAATAAARPGAGYVRVSTSRAIDGLPLAIVQVDTAEVNDERIGCLLVGPGMGDVPQVLTLALTVQAPKVIDADAITPPRRSRAAARTGRDHHAARRRIRRGCSARSRATRPSARWRPRGGRARWSIYKGPDTLVARPDGRLGFRSAGAGVAGECRNRRRPCRGHCGDCARVACDAFEAACAGGLAAWPRGRDRRTRR